MTTSNGGSQGRITAHVEGAVESANERGLRLDGESDWRNFSKWTAEPITPPRRGTNVRLGLDASGFIRELQVLDGGSVNTSSLTSPSRDREIRRMTSIKIAANVIGQFAQTHEEVRTDHIFPLADRILAWVEQPESEEE
ncbi:MAG: hypothetical protein ACR2IK_05685 [Chloroflexota bacterium]